MGCFSAGSILLPAVSLSARVPGPGTLPKKAASARLVNKAIIKTAAPADPISLINALLSMSVNVSPSSGLI